MNYKIGDKLVVLGISKDGSGRCIEIIGHTSTFYILNLGTINGNDFNYPIEEFDKMPIRFATNAEVVLYFKPRVLNGQ